MQSEEPRWLEVDEIIELDRLIVESTGEPFGILDYGLLNSAMARPINRYLYDEEQDVVSLAVCLLFGIARNHAFMQGNKRTGFEAALVFLEVNGYELQIADHPYLGVMIEQAVARKISEYDFEEAIRPFVLALPQPADASSPADVSSRG